MRYPVAFCVALLLAVLAPRVFAADSDTYASRLAAAKALAADGAHAQAASAFGAALALAPTEEERRQTGLALALERIRSGERTKAQAQLDALLRAYEDGAPRDAFWASVVRLAAEIAPRNKRLGLRLDVANWWASQPASPQVNAGFADAVQLLSKAMETTSSADDPVAFAQALELVRLAAHHVTSQPARANLALAYADLLRRSRFERNTAHAVIAQAFDEAVDAAQGTSVQPDALVERASWWLNAAPFGWKAWDATHKLTAESRPPQPGEADYRWLLDRLAEVIRLATANDLAWQRSEIERQRVVYATPSLQVGIGNAFAPSSVVPFRLEAQHIQRVAFALHRVDDRTLASVLSRDPKKPLPFLPAALAEWTVETGVKERLGRAESEQRFPQPLDAGLYVLIAQPLPADRAAPVVEWLAITRVQAETWTFTDRTLGVWVHDQFTGRPAKRVDAIAVHEGAIAPLNGDGDGHAQTVLRWPAKNDPKLTVIGDADGQPFVVDTSETYAAQMTAPEWSVHIFTDRPLYQPGETVHWKMVVRRHTRGQTSVPSGSPVDIRVALDDLVLGPWHETLNRFGTIAGEFRLPVDAPSRPATFEIGLPGDAGKFTREYDTFRVSHFRAPEAKLSLTPATDDALRDAQPGGELALTAAATYFSGEPVTIGDVALKVQFQRDWRYEADNEREGAVPPEPFELTASLDGSGHALFHVPIPSALPEHARLAVSARLESSGIAATSEFASLLTPAWYTAELSTRPNATTPAYAVPSAPIECVTLGKRATVHLYTRNATNDPVAAHGYVTTTRLDWEEVWRTPDGHLLTGDALRARQAQPDWPLHGKAALGWELLHGDHRRQAIETTDVATDTSGSATFTTPTLEPGRYRIEYFGEHVSNGGKPIAQMTLFIADTNTHRLANHTEQPVLIPCDSPQLPGRPVRVLLLVPENARSAIVALSTATTSEARDVHLDGNAAVIEFPWRPEMADGATIGVSVLAASADNNRDSSAVSTLSFSRADQKIAVAVQPPTNDAQPGDAARIAIKTTNARGEPVAAEVALTAADAAIAALAPGNHESIESEMLAFSNSTSLTAGRSGVVDVPPPPEAVAADLAPRTSDNIQLSAFTVQDASRGSYAAALALAPEATRVRTNFTYTAYWAPDIVTNDKGEAVAEFRYPDNLTEWALQAEAVTTDDRFGTGHATVRTSLPLQARLRMPQALVAGDKATLVGAVVNGTTSALPVTADLTIRKSRALTAEGNRQQQGRAAPDQEAQFRWPVTANAAGSATVRLTAEGGAASDAMEQTLPILEDGIVQRSGFVRRSAGQPATGDLVLPSPLDPSRTHVELAISAGVLPSVVAALPYLIDYPYGCVEQTTSRFVPAAVTAKVLRAAGFSPKAVDRALAARPTAPQFAAREAAGLTHLDDVVTQSLARLVAAQDAHGSFGWFAEGAPNAYMTGYVLRALNIATNAGLDVPSGLHARTLEAARDMVDDNDVVASTFDRAWLVAAIAEAPGNHDEDATGKVGDAYRQLFAGRSRLSDASIALLALTAHAFHYDRDAATLQRNLAERAQRSHSQELGDTVQWGATANYFRGNDGAVESTALCLQAIVRLDSQDPLATAAAHWLLANRQSNAWHNTRDTALAALALLDYAQARHETAPHGTVTLTLNDRQVYAGDFSHDSLLEPVQVMVDPADLHAGANRVVLETADGAVAYVVATVQSWAQARTVAPQGDLISVSRAYARISPVLSPVGQTIRQSHPLPNQGAQVQPGDLLECKVTINAKHDLDYVLIESPKPGGAEPVHPLSGWDVVMRPAGAAADAADAMPLFGRSWRVFREEHADRSALFLPHLPAGRWELVYTMKAAFSGDFRALPVTASAMYVPYIAANTEAERLGIKEP